MEEAGPLPILRPVRQSARGRIARDQKKNDLVAKWAAFEAAGGLDKKRQGQGQRGNIPLE
jgi:hypothetical protein